MPILGLNDPMGRFVRFGNSQKPLDLLTLLDDLSNFDYAMDARENQSSPVSPHANLASGIAVSKLNRLQLTLV
jgi:hypothetical protein